MVKSITFLGRTADIGPDIVAPFPAIFEANLLPRDHEAIAPKFKGPQ